MRLYIALIVWIVLAACNPKNELPKPGTWRAELTMQGQKLPFNFIVEKDAAGMVNVFIKNDTERLLLDEVAMVNDSVNINLHIFDARITAKNSGDSLNGFFILNYSPGYKLPFKAAFGQEFRFGLTDESVMALDYSGQYNVHFFNEKDTTKGVAIINQMGTYAKGTILTSTGDHRFLEGMVKNDTLHLSAFDGNHAYLYRVTMPNDSTLTGEQWMGKTRYRKWRGDRSAISHLPPAESLTFLKEGYEKLEFSFPDVSGKKFSLADDRFKDKVVIIQLLGSWCPNCMDETRFLVPWYEKNKARGVEVVGLAYERRDDFVYASSRVKKMIEKLSIPYPVLIAGVNDNAKAAETLPALNRVVGWPTTIFIGRDGKVKKIHTGFSGPGTGEVYEAQIQEFSKIVADLLAEP